MTITAKIIADSISEDNNRLTTFELRYPLMIHAEVMTHRIFSRNASSARAIPTKLLLEDIVRDTAMPLRWGLNGAGMQDHGEMSPEGQERMRSLWTQARDNAIATVNEMLAGEEKPHKQTVNRILAPFMHINVVLTSCNFSNFFALRRHKDADPTVYGLADAMWTEYKASYPVFKKYKDWHLPYITQEELDTSDDIWDLLKVSTARCARVSYKTRDSNKLSVFEEDLKLYERLVGTHPLHASPAEHQAYADQYDIGIDEWLSKRAHGNFTGWVQHRKLLEKEFVSHYNGETE